MCGERIWKNNEKGRGSEKLKENGMGELGESIRITKTEKQRLQSV